MKIQIMEILVWKGGTVRNIKSSYISLDLNIRIYVHGYSFSCAWKDALHSVQSLNSFKVQPNVIMTLPWQTPNTTHALHKQLPYYFHQLCTCRVYNTQLLYCLPMINSTYTAHIYQPMKWNLLQSYCPKTWVPRSHRYK